MEWGWRVVLSQSSSAEWASVEKSEAEMHVSPTQLILLLLPGFTSEKGCWQSQSSLTINGYMLTLVNKLKVASQPLCITHIYQIKHFWCIKWLLLYFLSLLLVVSEFLITRHFFSYLQCHLTAAFFSLFKSSICLFFQTPRQHLLW